MSQPSKQPYMRTWEHDLQVDLDFEDWHKLTGYAFKSYINTPLIEANYIVLLRWYMVPTRLCFFREPRHPELEVAVRRVPFCIPGGNTQKSADYGSVFTISCTPWQALILKRIDNEPTHLRDSKICEKADLFCSIGSSYCDS